MERLESLGILTPVKHFNWAAPVVLLLKQNGTIRLFRVTANQACMVDKYPLPRVEELFAAMAGGKVFSKLDMFLAYLQLPLDEKSSELVTINTHKGLFKYNRLPFGVASAPGVFQRCMEGLLQGCKGVSVYLDDILVTDSSVDDHLTNLDKVLDILACSGVARPGPTRACALPSTFQALPSAISFESRDSTMDQTETNCSANNHKSVTNINAIV